MYMTVSILFGGIFIFCETLSCWSPYSTIVEERVHARLVIALCPVSFFKTYMHLTNSTLKKIRKIKNIW